MPRGSLAIAEAGLKIEHPGFGYGAAPVPQEVPFRAGGYEPDVAARFMGYGWSVQRVGDANDLELLAAALEHFRHTDDRPTLIIVDSHIGYGAPSKQDTSAAHGEPLGEDEIRGAKRRYGWPEDAKFLVPDGVREHFAAGIGARGAAAHAAWNGLYARYRAAFPALHGENGLAQICSPECGVTQIAVCHSRLDKAPIRENRLRQIGALKVGPGQVYALSMNVA